MFYGGFSFVSNIFKSSTTNGTVSDSLNDSSNFTVPQPTVTITGQFTNGSIPIGQTFVINLNITNISNAVINGFELPSAGLKDFTVESTDPKCSIQYGYILIFAESLAPNATENIQILLSPNVAGNKDINFSVYSFDGNTMLTGENSAIGINVPVIQ